MSSLSTNTLNVTGYTTASTMAVAGACSVGGALSTTGNVSVGGALTTSGALSVTGDVLVNGTIVNTAIYNNGLPNLNRLPELSLPPARDIYEGLDSAAINIIEGTLATLNIAEIIDEMYVGNSTKANRSTYPGTNWSTYISNVTGINSRYDSTGPNYRRAGLPLSFTFADHIRGIESRVADNAPCARNIGQTFDETLYQDFYTKVGQLLSNIGCQGVYGPQADYGECLSQGRANEAYGEDPELIYKMSKAFINGLQNNNVAACVKHFVEGMALRDNSVSNKKFREDFLGGFTSMKDALFMMPGSYVGMNDLDCNLSSFLIEIVARRYFQFNGFVVTDAGFTNPATHMGTFRDSYQMFKSFIDAGTDMFLVDVPVTLSISNCITQYANESAANLERLKLSVRRIYVAKYKLKMFPQQVGYIPRLVTDISGNQLVDVDYKAKILNIARKSIVLLKNDGILPLSKSDSNVAITGTATTSKSIHIGGWAWGADSRYSSFVSTIPEAATKYSIKDGLAIVSATPFDASVGYTQTQKDEIIAWASANPSIAGTIVSDINSNVLPKFTYSDSEISNVVSNVSSYSKVIVCIGYDVPTTHQKTDELYVSSGTGGTYMRLLERYSGLEIPKNEQKLLQSLLDAGKQIIVVYCGNRIRVIPDSILSRVSAFLYAGELGNYGGQVIAETLYGDNNPSGRLTISWPRHTACYPVDYRHQMNMITWKFDACKVTDLLKARYDPAFRFGQGLSYNTNFVHSNIVATTDLVNNVLNVTIQTTNNGSVTGKDLVAIYGCTIFSGITTCKDSSFFMLDYKRVDLNAGETKTVSFAIPLKKLSMVPGDYHQTLTKKLVLPSSQIIISDDHNQTALINNISNQWETSTSSTVTIPTSIVSSTIADSSNILGSVLTFTSPIYFDSFAV
jgi:beta-glucosidase